MVAVKALIMLALGVRLLGVCPEPQEILDLPGGQPFALTAETVIVLPARYGEADRAGAQMLADAVREAGGVDLRIVSADDHGEGPAIRVFDRTAPDRGLDEALRGAFAGIRRPGPEGYLMAVDGEQVVIVGDDGAGAFYGLMTLRQLLMRSDTLPAMLLRDYPDMPLRATYGGWSGLTPEMRDLIDRLAAVKMNVLVTESGHWYDFDEEKVAKAREIQAYCRARHIEWVPLIQSFGHAGQIVGRDGRTAEGVWVEGEAHTLGVGPVELAHRNVIYTEASPVAVRSADGKTRYEEGRDFEVIEGVTAYPFSASLKPWAIRRLEAGRIPEGAAVSVSYNYAPRGMNSYCPLEPRTQEIMKRAIEDTVRALHPRYLHIGHDEPQAMRMDSRCLDSKMSEGEILAWEVNRLRSYARGVDRDVQIMMWADACNPYHNATRERADDATRHMEKDVIQCAWFYGDGEMDRASQSLDYMLGRGLPVTGSPWYRLKNAYAWSQVLDEARQRDRRTLGALYTSWDRRWQALAITAEYAWSASKPDPGSLFEALSPLQQRSPEPPAPEGIARRIAAEVGAAAVRGQSPDLPAESRTPSMAALLEAYLPALADVPDGVNPFYDVLRRFAAVAAGDRVLRRAMALYVDGEFDLWAGRREEGAQQMNAMFEALLAPEAQAFAPAARDLAEAWRSEGALPEASALFGVSVPLRRPVRLAPGDQPLAREQRAGITASSTAGDAPGPEAVADGDFGTAWRAAAGAQRPVRLTLDLGRAVALIRTDLSSTPRGRVSGYAVEVSGDGDSFSEVAEREVGEGRLTDTATFEPVRARYLRIALSEWEGDAPSVSEVRVWGVKPEAVVRVPSAATAPTLDGRLDDGCWESAAVAGDFVRLGDATQLAREQTTVRICRDADHLYLAFDCPHPSEAPYDLDRYERDSAVWGDDSVEVFVAPGGVMRYVHFVASAAGVQFDERVEAGERDRRWDGSWRCAARRGAGGYVIELAIPFADLGGAPEAGDVWGINFCRQQHSGSDEASEWSWTGPTSFHVPERFGKAAF